MNRIFILSVNTATEPYPVYPLGMAVIAAALIRRGHEVRQFDFLAAGCSRDALRQDLAEFTPDYVCVSLRNIDTVDSFATEKDWYLSVAKELIELARGVTAVPIIVGGSGFSIMPEEILDFTGADYGVVGEGEVAVCELVAALTDHIPMSRIIDGNRAPLSDMQMSAPHFEQGLLEYYTAQGGIIGMPTKRGCPYICGYCTYPALEGRRFRAMMPEEVVDNLERLWLDNGIDSIFFTDSIFNDPADNYLQLAEELLRRNLPIKWSAFFRPQGINREKIALLKQSGLYAVEFGTDAASDTALRALKKRFSFAEALEASEACLAEQVPCAHFVIFGGPDETSATVEEGLRNMEQLGRAVVFAFSGIRILPHTDIHARAVREGSISVKTALLKPLYYFSPQIDPEEMNAAITKSFHGQSNRIFPPPAGREKMAILRRLGLRGILWDKLISFSSKTECVDVGV
ncbi:MAG: lipid biosynthesis B12-binding/radical SAM protein [Nitrospirota bacterium]|nr:lipid biosynthesis B12-binding/radical SAM protein [Nitrospirota bacterium]